MLGKFMTHNHCHRDKPEIPNKHPYSDRPTLTFRPFIENNPKVHLKWNTTSVNGSSFVYYNLIDWSKISTRKLNPGIANILSLMWRVPIGRPMRKDAAVHLCFSLLYTMLWKYGWNKALYEMLCSLRHHRCTNWRFIHARQIYDPQPLSSW
jgi:hypothetical protein